LFGDTWRPSNVFGSIRLSEQAALVACTRRCHHQLAAAIYPDATAPGGWRWSAIGHLPPEEPGHGHDREGARNYSELLAQRPVLETLEIVERHFRSLVPEHEL
jgi:hypothetical protein